MGAAAREIGFDDESVKGGFSDRPKGYQPEFGRVDRIRFLTKVYRYFGARVEQRGKTDVGFFCVSCASLEDSLAAAEGDKDALERCKKACPLYEKGYEVKLRFAALICFIESENRGRVTSEMKFLPWGFGPDKYTALRALDKSLPPGTSGKMQMQAVEILVTCTDNKFQKCTFNALTHRGQLRTSFKQCMEKSQDLFEVPMDWTSKCLLVEEFIASEGYQKALASIERMELGKVGGTGTGAPDDFDRGQAQQRRQAPPQQQQRGGPPSDHGGEADQFDNAAGAPVMDDPPPPVNRPAVGQQQNRGPAPATQQRQPVGAGAAAAPAQPSQFDFDDDIPT